MSSYHHARESFLTPYERDVLALETHEAMADLMQHLGMDASGMGFHISMDKVRKRRLAREYPPRVCMRHECDNAVTYVDMDVFQDGEGYCDEHRPDPSVLDRR